MCVLDTPGRASVRRGVCAETKSHGFDDEGVRERDRQARGEE